MGVLGHVIFQVCSGNCPAKSVSVPCGKMWSPDDVQFSTGSGKKTENTFCKLLVVDVASDVIC